MKFPDKKYAFVPAACLLIALIIGSGPAGAQDLTIENEKIVLAFDRDNGALVSFRDPAGSRELLDKDRTPGSPWQVYLLDSSPGAESPDAEKVDFTAASGFSFARPDSSTLFLTWKDFSGPGNGDLQITAEIRLRENDPLSYWNISLEGTAEKRISRVIFPRIPGIKDPGGEKLAVPVWMGQLMEDPRSHLSSREDGEKKFEWSYPGGLSMQFLALYNPEETGFYAAANDSLSYRKSFSLSLDTLNTLTYEMTAYPALDSRANSYSLPYEAKIGSFRGDWITAAERYREWGSEQSWSRNSRLRNGLTPSWLEETALWVWNREESEHVLSPAVDLKNELGLPVSVLWHWWHRDSYDDSFPEYFPPREGEKPFRSAVAAAREEGVRALVYMNQLQWGTSTESFEDENASRYTVRDIDGEMRSHTYNIFTGKSLTNMCIATDFWRDKYASLAGTALNDYRVGGIYMDQACLSRMCYDRSHGHEIGGGNYWAQHSAGLTDQIRAGSARGNQPVLAGEGGLESYLPYLDLFLTLQVSSERYAGIRNWKTIPLFQAVYHQYGITFGSYSSLLTPPYDDKWPEKYAPEEEQALLDEDFNRQFLMEQARSFVWGMQPTIANYKSFLASEREEEIGFLKKLAKVRSEALKYLLHGKFERSPQIVSPRDNIHISRLSIYAGRKNGRVTAFEGNFPLIYSGTWRSGDDRLAIALASISDDPHTIDTAFDADEYGLSPSGDIFVIDAEGKRRLSSYSGGDIEISYTMDPKDLSVLEIIPDTGKDGR